MIQKLTDFYRQRIVTHDREDAFHVADRIAEMDQGRIVRIAEASVLRSEWSAQPFTP